LQGGDGEGVAVVAVDDRVLAVEGGGLYNGNVSSRKSKMFITRMPSLFR